MNNRVEIEISDRKFTLLSEGENGEYIRRVAAYADEMVRKVQTETRRSSLESALLACVNISDEYFREKEASSGLREQLRGYIDELSTAKNQVSDLRRELARHGKQR